MYALLAVDVWPLHLCITIRLGSAWTLLACLWPALFSASAVCLNRRLFWVEHTSNTNASSRYNAKDVESICSRSNATTPISPAALVLPRANYRTSEYFQCVSRLMARLGHLLNKRVIRAWTSGCTSNTSCGLLETEPLSPDTTNLTTVLSGTVPSSKLADIALCQERMLFPALIVIFCTSLSQLSVVSYLYFSCSKWDAE